MKHWNMSTILDLFWRQNSLEANIQMNQKTTTLLQRHGADVQLVARQIDSYTRQTF